MDVRGGLPTGSTFRFSFFSATLPGLGKNAAGYRNRGFEGKETAFRFSSFSLSTDGSWLEGLGLALSVAVLGFQR